jgi:hypothetical protein
MHFICEKGIFSKIFPSQVVANPELENIKNRAKQDEKANTE